jgi:hypothetical protein
MGKINRYPEGGGGEVSRKKPDQAKSEGNGD